MQAAAGQYWTSWRVRQSIQTSKFMKGERNPSVIYANAERFMPMFNLPVHTRMAFRPCNVWDSKDKDHR